MAKKNILITGASGVGKTTLIKKVADGLKERRGAGFYTVEIREEGERAGFELISLDGRRWVLSHADIKSPYRVGRYGVDVRGFESVLGYIPFLAPSTELVIVDEIGPMECFSDRFRALMEEVLDAEKPVIATVALEGDRLVREVKERPDVRLFEVTKENRDALLEDILKAVKEAG